MTRTKATRRDFLQLSGLLVGGGIGLGANPAVTAGENACSPVKGQCEDGIILHPDAHASDIMEGFPPPLERRVTIENWGDTTETVRWTNNNPEHVFRMVPVDRGDGPVWELPRRMTDPEKLARANVRWGLSREDSVQISVSEWLQRSETDGITILHDGHIISEQYFGQFSPSTRRHLWSAGKGLMASIFARYLADGTVDERALITDYLPELGDTGFKGATVRHALDQTTAIDMQFPLSDWVLKQPPEVQREWLFASPEQRRADHEFARHLRAGGLYSLLPEEGPWFGMYDYVRTVKRDGDHEHGDYFNYASANSAVVQQMLERVTGQSYFEHLSQLLADLGVESSISMLTDAAGIATPHMGTAITLRDFARWGQMVCDRGRTGFGHALPGVHEFVDDIQENPGYDNWTDETNLRPGNAPGTGYRSQMFVCSGERATRRSFFAAGAYLQDCLIDPANRTVVVQMASFWDMAPDKIDKGDRAAHLNVALESLAEETLPQLLGEG